MSDQSSHAGGRSSRSILISGLDVYASGTSWRNLVFLKVRTDSGITGWGEATVEYRETAVMAHLEFLERLVTGLNALAPALVWKHVVDDDFMRGDVVGLAAASALMVACLDIAGKAYGLPLYRLLGGAIRDHIPVYANGWYRGERSQESFASLAQSVATCGHTRLKVDPFGSADNTASIRDVMEGIELLAAIRHAVGSGMDIFVDAHGRFAPAAARRVTAALGSLDIGFLEEPVAPHDLEALRTLRASSPVPIAAGERCLGRVGFRPLIEHDCVDVIQPDISWCGGPFEAQRIAAWADLHQMLVSFHNANSPFSTAVGCHVAATVPNLLVLESFDDFDDPWIRDAFPGAPRVVDGSLALPQAPGVGIEPDEEMLREHPYHPVYMDLNTEGWELRQAVLD